MWRIHRYVDNQVKFWMPSVDSNYCFRRNLRFDNSISTIRDSYKDIIDAGLNTIVASHTFPLDIFYSSDCIDLFTKDQVKLYLQTKNPVGAWLASKKKNLTEFSINDPPFFNGPKYESQVLRHVDFSYYIEDIVNDWRSFKNFADSVNVQIDSDAFVHYKQIVTGDFCYLADYHESCLDNGLIKYKNIRKKLLTS